MEENTEMVGIPCALCQKKAFYPAAATGKIKFDFLLEHVRNDVGYRPYYCAHTSCVGSWPSERLINRHHQLIHRDEERLVFNQRQSILDHDCERLTNIVFPGVVESKRPPEKLIDYVKSEDATTFITDLHKWWSHVHLEYVLKSATPEEEEDDAQENAQSPTKRVKLELVDYRPPEGSTEPIVIEIDDQDDAGPLDSLEPQPQPPNVPVSLSQQPGPKKHVYAKYVMRTDTQLKRPRGRPRIHLARSRTIVSTAAVKQSSSRNCGGTKQLNVASSASSSGRLAATTTKPSNPRRSNWASFNKRWRLGNAATAGHDATASNTCENSAAIVSETGKNSTAIVLDTGENSTAIASDTGEPSAFYPTVASLLKAATAVDTKKSPKAIQRIRRPCAECGIRVLAVSQRKHVESHLQKLGEYRFECLLCLTDPSRSAKKRKRLRTMFEDTTKIRHIPIVHGVPKPIEGVHFRDFTIEHGLKEKRRLMHQKCFPRVSKECSRPQTDAATNQPVE